VAEEEGLVLRLYKVIRQRPARHTVKRSCQIVRERDFRLIADQIEDLSSWGMRVGPADPALTGQTLLVSFQVPGQDLWIDTEALVTRVIHGRRPGEYRRSLGLEFVALRPWHRYLLKRSLEIVPRVPIGPRPGRRSIVTAKALAQLMPAMAH
jgi:hypothetical protein